MSSIVLSCVLCGCFTLQNGTISLSTQSLQFSEAIIYDTVIKADTGPPAHAKIFITGHQMFPDGSTICAIAKGGPIHPFGYVMHVASIISLDSNPPLYRDLSRRSRVNVTGKIVTPVARLCSNEMCFILETVAHINNNAWNWLMR